MMASLARPPAQLQFRNDAVGLAQRPVLARHPRQAGIRRWSSGRCCAASSAPAASETWTWTSRDPPRTALCFPGQGAQSVGMGAELAARSPAARAVFERASEVLGYDVLELCARGPAERLNSTTSSQPAIYTCSLAGLAALEEEPSGRAALAEVDAVAGLSLGEYTALTFAEAWSFETGLRLVAARGEAMQAASERARTGMLSVVGLDRADVEKLAKEANARIVDPGQHVALANLLCPGNYVLSGGLDGCATAARLARPRGARMAVPLAVAGAFHSRHMAPAAEALREALARADVRAPRRVVLSNVDALPHASPDEVRDSLLRQLTQPVRWEESVRALVDRGLARVLEVGPGKVIAGTVRRISKGLEVRNEVV